MKLSQGEVLGWVVVSEVLQSEERAEWELLSDVVVSNYEGAASIGKQPGAFDLNSISLLAHACYAIVCAGLQAAAPKLFDAAIDVGKDELKRRLSQPAKMLETHPLPVRSIEIRNAMAKAALAYKLSDRTANMLADSLIASLAEKSLL